MTTKTTTGTAMESTAATREETRSGPRPSGWPGSPGAAGPLVAPSQRLRRRPVLIGVSVAAVCLGSLGTVLAWSASSTTRSVVAVASGIERGATISQADLMVVQVGVDPVLRPVPADDAAALVGLRAAVDMAAGTLVTREQLTSSVVPPRGMSIVGVSVPASLLPGEPLRAGDRVRVVATPGLQGEVAAGPQPAFPAVVVGVYSDGERGDTVVSVQVPETAASEVAARAATGRVVVVLDSRER